MTAIGKVSLQDTVLQRGRSRERSRLLVFNHTVLLLLTAFRHRAALGIGFQLGQDESRNRPKPLGPPVNIVTDNFPNAWDKGNFATTMGNSIIYVVATIAAELVFGGLAAYALARKNRLAPTRSCSISWSLRPSRSGCISCRSSSKSTS